MKTNIDKVNCGKYPKPEIWREKEDDGTSGLQVCSLTGKYSCNGCKYYGASLTREEEIVKTADKFAEGYKHDVAASTGFYHGALWADAHPKNPWISVTERLPEEDRKEDGSRKYYSQPVFIRYEKIWDGQTKPSVYYGISFVFYTSDTPAWSNHNTREGQCTERITHWMPIPKIEKGGEQ